MIGRFGSASPARRRWSKQPCAASSAKYDRNEIQFALPGVIEIDADEATTRTFSHESARGPGDKYYRNHCMGFDRLRSSDDGWKFTNRSFQYLWLATAPFSGGGFPLFPDSVAG